MDDPINNKKSFIKTLFSFKKPSFNYFQLKNKNFFLARYQSIFHKVQLFLTQIDPQKLERGGKILATLICAHYLSEIGYISWQISFTEKSPFSQKNYSFPTLEDTTTNSFNATGIIKRNLFNSEGKMPGDEIATESPINTQPVRSLLPLKLLGIALFDHIELSTAVIEDRDHKQTYPVQKDDEIPNLLRVTSIEKYRVIFINLQNNKKEYLEMENLSPTQNVMRSFDTSSAPTTQFNIARTEIDQALGDLNNVLTQARAVPNFENGQINGYKLFQIVPQSIYDKIGLKNGDIILGINGKPMSDPSSIFEQLNQLKEASHVETQVKRDGKMYTMSYDIK